MNITDGYVVQAIATKSCVAVSTEYSLAVSFTNGLQHVEYTTGPTQDILLQITFNQSKIDSALSSIIIIYKITENILKKA